ncbi:U-box domain-containing protein 4 [Cryptomeria japonica]|uniref:U-box domain-containing protein 4 n=1 Tax=Cryptomeria japonica TaxID=3369 RepID=UPI0025ABA657|nr:U-box domain-containing protein 4 [Cryptomeria japonica]
MDPLHVLFADIYQSIHEIVTLNGKIGADHSNCQCLVEQLKLLKPLLDDVKDSKTALTGSVVRVFEELCAALKKARELIERCSAKGSKVYRVLRSQQYIAKFRNVSLDIYRVLNSLPLSSLHIPDQIQLQVEICAEELRRLRYTCESLDEQTLEEVESVLRDHREGLKISCEKLQWIADRFNLISNQEVLKEASALEKEKEYVRLENDKQEEEYINDVIGVITQICDYLVEVKQCQTEGVVPIPADFRCPLSLELMSDPVIVASGQTYERAYIQQWLDQGMTTCPKTRQTLSHTNLIPNYTVKALIANWCESNNVPLPEPAKLPTCTMLQSQTFQMATKKKELDDIHFSSTRDENAAGNLRISNSQPTLRNFTSSMEDRVSQKENMGLVSSSENQEGLSTVSGPLSDTEQESPSMKGTLNGNHGCEQLPEQSRKASISSVTSSLDDRQELAVGGTNALEGLKASSDGSQFSSDISGELKLATSVKGPQNKENRDTETSNRISERSVSSGLPLWNRRIEDRSSMPRIISSMSDTRADSPNIVLKIEKLVDDLESDIIEVQRVAAAELRLLAKYNMENRIIIANCRATRPLVALLHCSDMETQDNAVTALLNLSINDNNKIEIVAAGAIDPLIYVLKTGSPEARENAAATLFSLSVMEENKTIIGQSGAIPPLVDLLRDGTPRGKKDAATALFNLSIYHENKARIVRAGAIQSLVELMDPAAGMVDKAVAVLANLSTIPEGRFAIGEQGGIPALVEVVELGSQRGKENAAAALLQLCTNSNRFRALVLQEGAIPPLVSLAQSGTPRAKEKAQALLRHFRDQRHAVIGRGGPDRQLDRHFDRL